MLYLVARHPGLIVLQKGSDMNRLKQNCDTERSQRPLNPGSNAIQALANSPITCVFFLPAYVWPFCQYRRSWPQQRLRGTECCDIWDGYATPNGMTCKSGCTAFWHLKGFGAHFGSSLAVLPNVMVWLYRRSWIARCCTTRVGSRRC